MAIYNYYKEHQSNGTQAPCFPTFWLYAKVDFSKQPMGINDDLRLFKVQDGWLLLRGYTRCLTASGVANTIDIGTAQNGVEIDAAANANSAGDWIVTDTLAEGAEIALTADGYIWLDNNTAAVEKGEFEIAIQVFCAPGDMEDFSGDGYYHIGVV